MMIELNGVSVTQPSAPDLSILEIENWSVADRQTVFVHGPSGSGKSTLLNLVSGLLECREGDVSVLGERLDQMSRRRRDRFRANHIGYVFQRFNLIHYLNAIENIELARSFSERGDRRTECRYHKAAFGVTQCGIARVAQTSLSTEHGAAAASCYRKSAGESP